ncbi:MAG: DUF2946 domain-containing protein [bacterium]|nr:DUF2946 domain-containing protein [bacterium]
MKILRKGEVGGRLALFAMLLQLAFTYGHVDLPHYHGSGELELVTEHLFVHSSPYHDKSHKSHESDKSEHDRCPTCWTLDAAGALILHVTAFKLLSERRFETDQSVITTSFFSLAFLLYQGRAPPMMAII